MSQPRPYHHGDLRRALIDAGMRLVAERGMARFTLREVARAADVSPSAPYHHFENLAALVEALAIECFDRLTSVLRQAADITPSTPLDRLQAIGVAYVRFAMEQPGVFAFLFRPELRSAPGATPDDASPAVAAAAGRMHQLVIETVAAGQRDGLIESGNASLLAMTCWCTVHGLATLLLHGELGQRSSPEDVNQLASAVTATLSRGLLTRNG